MILKIDKNGFSGIELAIVIAVLSIFSALTIPAFNSVNKRAISTAAKQTIKQIKKECETNYIYGIEEFTNSDINGYELEIKDLKNCEGDPNHGFINLIPTEENDNPTISYDFNSGLLTCFIPNTELTTFPDCKKITKSKKKYRCNDIGDWKLAQELLNKGHSYLDRDKDGEACEALSRNSDKPENGKVFIESCYDGDTCTTTNDEKIRLACIDTPELRGRNADPIEAKKSKDFLNNLISGKEVDIRRITEDRYGRTVAELSLSGLNFQQELVNNGYAKIYKKYSDPCPWTKDV